MRLNRIIIRKKEQQAFVLLASLFVLVAALVLAHFMSEGSLVSEKVSGDSHRISHAQHVSDTASVTMIHDTTAINAALSKIGSPGATPTRAAISLPSTVSTGATAEGEISVQELMPINSSPNVIKAYLLSVDVDVEANGVTRQIETGYLHIGTANTGYD